MQTTDTLTITAPVINMNGSSRRSLLADHIACMETLRAALKALGTIMPHGRDYQTAKTGQYETARADMVRRIQTVHAIRDEVEQVALAISDQY